MKAGDKKRRKTWKGRTVYWDTCVVLSWIKNEQRKPGHMEGVEEAVREIAKGEIGLITSVLTRAEVWDTKLNSTQKNRLDKLFRRTNVAYVPLDFAIAELTSELRDFYHASDFELLLPDAIHLATAIHLDAIEFQTFDGVNTRPPKNPEKSKAGLLNLDEWGIHLTQAATRCCGRAKASTKKRIPRLLLWRGVGLRSASDSRSCRPKAATAMNSRVGRLGGHSHDSRNLTFLFRSREATTHRVYLNEVDTPLWMNLSLEGR